MFNQHTSKSVLEQNFWSHVQKTADCWLWTGAVHPKWGYGNVTWEQKNWSAHHLAWVLSGRSLPKRPKILRHSCDNPRCVNPKHLIPGSHRFNMRDMALRERGTSKISNEQVQKIRRIYSRGKTLQRELAESYGVTQHTISRILSGTRRQWV